MKTFYSLTVLIVYLALFIAPSFAQTTSPWPMFHHDVCHTGKSPYIGPEVPDINWSYYTDTVILSSPTIGNDGKIYFGASYALYALNTDGSFFSNYITGGNVTSTPAVWDSGQGEIIFFGSDDGFLYALMPNKDSLNLIWSYSTGSPIKTSPSINNADGTVYVGSNRGYLYAFSSTTGTPPSWSLSWTLWVGQTVCSPAIGIDQDKNVIYIGSSYYNFYAIDPGGYIKWSFSAGGGISSSPAVDGNENIYFGSDYGTVYALTPDTVYPKTFFVDI